MCVNDSNVPTFGRFYASNIFKPFICEDLFENDKEHENW